MTEVLWPDQVRLSSHRLWTASKDLLQEDADWYIVHRLSHKVRPIGPFPRNREPVLAGCQKQNETTFGAAVGNNSSTLARKPLETVTLRRCLNDPKHSASGPALHRSSSSLEARLHSQELNSHSDPVRPSVRPSKQRAIGSVRKRQSYRKRQINAANRELQALLLSNRRWNWSQIADDDRRACRTVSSERTASSVKGVGHSDNVATRVSKHELSFSADGSKEVIVPSWRVVETKRRYVIEQTEDLDDEVFKLRHQKLELGEKRRKRWDDQRLRGLELLERSHNRKDPFAINSHTEPTSSSACKDIDMTTVKVIEAEPVIAFGHFIACIPPKDFSLPEYICQQLTSVKFKRPKSSNN